ncbi:MAG: hypothetical protein IKB07_03055 [Lachnospiraceae bacterium]|nr:hypothetical protein [Lachnospiraceae bacterium]
MKKKALIYIGCIAMLAGMLTGCGTNAETSNSKNEKTEKEVVQESVTNQTPETTDSVASEVPESATTSEPKLYDRLSAWDEFYKEYNCYYSAIQIEDMFFHPGMMGSEVAEVVATGKDTAIIQVSVDKLFEPDEEEGICETQKVTYYRNETPWFDVYVRNYTGELLPFGDCIVSLIVPREAAMEYCRFFDGTYSLSSIKKITYKDYDKFSASLENTGYFVEKDGSTWRVKSTEEFCPASLSEKVLYWTSHDIWMDMKIDSDTGCVTEMTPWERALDYSECQFYTASIPEDYDWSKTENEKRLAGVDISLDFWNVNFREEEVEVEVVSVFKCEDGNFVLVYREKDMESGELLCYKVGSAKIEMDWTGYIIAPEFMRWRARTDAYVLALDSAEQIYSINAETDLLYEYDKNLIIECKTVNSFADITADHVYQMAEIATEKAKEELWRTYDIGFAGVNYMTFANVNKITEHELAENSNAFWMVIAFHHEDGDVEYVAVDFYNPHIAVETNKIIWDSDTILYTSRAYSDLHRLLEDIGLSGAAKENSWVTEAMPQDLYREVNEKYGYLIMRDSLDM